jgi:hypothetical protein
MSKSGDYEHRVKCPHKRSTSTGRAPDPDRPAAPASGLAAGCGYYPGSEIVGHAGGRADRLEASQSGLWPQGAWVEGKGRKTRFVAFDDEAWAAIQAYLTERNDEALPAQVERYPLFCRHDRKAKVEARLPLSTRAIQRLIEQLSEQANLSGRFNLSPHSLRHYFANGLLELTGNIALVQEALGHQGPKTTRGYTRVKKWNKSLMACAPWVNRSARSAVISHRYL